MGHVAENKTTGIGGWWRKAREALFAGEPQFNCLQVEVSSRCPGRCLYCPRAVAGVGSGMDMSMAVFSRVAPVFRYAQRVHLQGWGEPFLNPSFFTMARIAQNAGCRVSTTTCGLDMSESWAEAILDTGLDIVAFSLVGTDEGSNRQRRGVPFDRVRHAIATLAKARRQRGVSEPQLHLAYLLLPENIEALAGLPRLMEELGVAAAVVSTLDYLPDPALAEHTFVAADRALLGRAATLLAETACEAERCGLSLYHQFPRAQGVGHGCLENISRSLFIAADGMVSPCVFTNAPGASDDPRRRVFGNVLTEDPLTVWRTPAYRTFRRDLAEGHPQSPCLTCRKRFSGP
jgi:MoaA/NifB/PqqE/SkfB family radical SAM enzyme